jgi:Flp pilus assembly protein TadD
MLPLFARVVERFSDVADAHYGYAFLASRLGRNDEVLESVDRALTLKPGWEDPALVKLSVFAADQRDAEFDEFASGFLEKNPDAHRLRTQYARHLAQQEKFDEAISQLRELTRRQPEDAEAVYALALLYMERGDWSQADRTLRRHLELSQGDDRTRLNLGRVAIERKRYDKAIEWLSAVKDENYYLDAQIQMAHALARRDGVDAGIEHLRGVIPASAQEQVRLYLAQEQVMRDAGQLEEARGLLDAALSEMPDNGDLLYARGLLTARLGQVEAHERDLRRLIELEPDNAHAYNALGYTLADLTDRYQEALTLIEKALELQPEDPFILDSMGWVQYRLGNHVQAIEYLEQAMNIRADAEIAAHLGEVLWVTGRQDEARKVWERGRETGEDNHVLEETVERFLEQ